MRWEAEPVCLAHGLPHSEHKHGQCLYCCLCFKGLEPEECSIEDGQRTDVCWSCRVNELKVMLERLATAAQALLDSGSVNVDRQRELSDMVTLARRR